MEKMMLGTGTAAKIVTEDDVKRYVAEKMFEVDDVYRYNNYPCNVFFYLDNNGDMCTPFSKYRLGSNGKIYYPMNKESYDYNIPWYLNSDKDITIPTSDKEYSAIDAPNISFFKSKTSTTIYTAVIDGKFSIPEYVTHVDINIVSDTSIISVDNNNAVYDSRENCNAIIETATNTMIKGNSKTVIPDTVTTIGNNCFHDSFPAIIPTSVSLIKKSGITVSFKSGMTVVQYQDTKKKFKSILESDESISIRFSGNLKVVCTDGSLVYTKSGVTES